MDNIELLNANLAIAKLRLELLAEREFSMVLLRPKLEAEHKEAHVALGEALEKSPVESLPAEDRTGA